MLRDRWRLAEGRVVLGLPALDCYPRPAVQQTRVVLSRLPQRLGEHTARAAGEGAEFGGVREYVPGDRQRRINWPATTRRGRLQVNTFRRSAPRTWSSWSTRRRDEGEPGDTVVDLALRGAAGAARAYLAARDRVGFISYRSRAALAGAGAGPAAVLPDRRGHADRGAGSTPTTPVSPGCPGPRCRPAR